MYTKDNSGIIIRVSDGISILPKDVEEFYPEYLEWLAEGNEPERRMPIRLNLDTDTLISDGVDEAILTVVGIVGEEVVIEVQIGELETTFTLTLDCDGICKQPISSDTPGTKIIFQCEDSLVMLRTI